VSVVCRKVEVSARSPTDCGASLCVFKKPRKRGGYSPARGLENTYPQWVVAPVKKKKSKLNELQESPLGICSTSWSALSAILLKEMCLC
jgi:hypothetical protein